MKKRDRIKNKMKKLEKFTAKILNIDYAINLKTVDGKNGDTIWGNIDTTNEEINLSEQLNDKQIIGTLIHEIIHGCFTALGNNAQDEKLVSGLGDMIHFFIVENPKLCKFILNNCKPEAKP